MTTDWVPKVDTAEGILAEAVNHFADRIALSCSFGGPGGMVLVHMLSLLRVKIPVIFLDTQFLFDETLALRDDIAARYDIQVLTYRPALSPESQAETHGDRLWQKDPDACCHLRKVEPMQRAIEDLRLDAWITALRRDQSPTRQSIGTTGHQTLASGRVLVKVYPLAGWTKRDVWTYIHEHEIPYHPLLDQGYASLGCTHCTAPSSGDERAGRWQGQGKTECGLHVL